MTFRFFDTIRADLSLNLEVLSKDTNLYTTLMFQHEGTFHIAPAKFGNQTDCFDLFTQFLRLAKTQNASLAVTPEYSCPWSTVRSVLADQNQWPDEQKLWVLGCESIRPDEIRTIRDNNNNNDIIIHFDDAALQNGGGNLLDPMCYIFKARLRQDNTVKLILLVQFKTLHMGVWRDDVEQERYIPGNEIYVLRNDVNSINLFTLICSEVANFRIDNNFRQQLENRWDENPYLILNIQMNPKPSFQFFKTFRTAIMEYQNKEIISLNWSSGSTFSTGQPILAYSKSGILYKSEQMDYDFENRYIENHKRGLYYTYKTHGQHTYYLNSKAPVFLIANHKPAAGGVNAALLRRTGPEARNNFVWNQGTSSFEPTPEINDEFIAFLHSLTCANTVFHDPAINIIDKERLVNISIGKAKCRLPGDAWHKIDKLHTFFLDDDEVIRRLTFLHDEDGDPQRRDYIEYIDIINLRILPNPDSFPDTFSVFRNNCTQLMFINDDGYNYKHNLVTTDGKHKATVAYIGRTDYGAAEKTLKNLQRVFAKNDQSKKLTLVWYKQGIEDIIPVTETAKPKLTDDSTKHPASISKE
jgi:hypothetical protein